MLNLIHFEPKIANYHHFYGFPDKTQRLVGVGIFIFHNFQAPNMAYHTLETNTSEVDRYVLQYMYFPEQNLHKQSQFYLQLSYI